PSQSYDTDRLPIPCRCKSAPGIARYRNAARAGAARTRLAASGDGDRGADRGRASRAAPRAPCCFACRRTGSGARRPAPGAARNMIELSEQEGLAILRLTDGKANTMTTEFCEALIARLKEALPARAVVITGSGRIFSAGVDL